MSRGSCVTGAAYIAGDLASSWEALQDRVSVWCLSRTLDRVSQGESAAARGVRAFLLSWRVAHRDRLQWVDGRGYVETCPAYLATMDGVTRWAAAQGWSALQSVVGWVESKVQEVTRLGVRLRTLGRGVRRGGRHLLLDPWMVLALDRVSGWTRKAPRSLLEVPRTPRVDEVLRSTPVRTVAVSCPHHHDRDPSLVLWSNGGAKCLSCGWRGAWSLGPDSVRLHTSPGSRPHRGRYNIRPPQHTTPSQEGPVGGCVSTRSNTRTTVGVRLTEYQTREGDWRRTRSRGHALRGDLLEVLERAEARSLGDSAQESAAWASWTCGGDLPGRAVVPDLLVSTSSMGRSHWRDRWEARIQRWVLVDLDGVEGLDTAAGTLVSTMEEVVRQDPESSGRMAVVRTSGDGLQVWVELAQARHSPRTWCALVEVRQWYRSLASRLLQAAHQCGASGGVVDSSSLGAGRYGRRPGWRWKQGQVYRSHLLGVVRTPGV